MSELNFSRSEYNNSCHFYDKIMNAFEMDFSLYEDLIEILKPKSVLEMGCGMGRLFPIFAQEAKTIVGVDLSDELLSQGEKRLSDYGNDDTSISFVNADMCMFRDGRKYEMIVFALSVLKHLNSHEAKLKALENAKRHLSDDGFIVVDHTPFLYTSKTTDWIDSRRSLVADWVTDARVLNGYQWRKTVEGDRDVLEWRYGNSSQSDFQVKYTTYRYDNDKLMEHLNELGMTYELLLTEWGVNGLTNQGKRFIGILSNSPHNTFNRRQELVEKIQKRNEKLWSDYDLYLEAMAISV